MQRIWFNAINLRESFFLLVRTNVLLVCSIFGSSWIFLFIQWYWPETVRIVWCSVKEKDRNRNVHYTSHPINVDLIGDNVASLRIISPRNTPNLSTFCMFLTFQAHHILTDFARALLLSRLNKSFVIRYCCCRNSKLFYKTHTNTCENIEHFILPIFEHMLGFYQYQFDRYYAMALTDVTIFIRCVVGSVHL